MQDAHIGEQVTRALLPNTIYANSSGGDPRHIPELSHARWREFHRCFYHPSNARICFWGDDPEETRLRIVDEALKPFDRQPVSEKIALQSRFNPGGVPQNGVRLDGDRSQARGVGEVLVALAGEFVEGGIVGGRIRRVLVELVAKVPGCLELRSNLFNDCLYLLFRSGIQVVAGLLHHLDQLADGGELPGIVGNGPEHLDGTFHLRARCVGGNRQERHAQSGMTRLSNLLIVPPHRVEEGRLLKER